MTCGTHFKHFQEHVVTRPSTIITTTLKWTDNFLLHSFDGTLLLFACTTKNSLTVPLRTSSVLGRAVLVGGSGDSSWSGICMNFRCSRVAHPRKCRLTIVHYFVEETELDAHFGRALSKRARGDRMSTRTRRLRSWWITGLNL